MYLANVVRRGLINKVVEPVAKQQVGVSSPTHYGTGFWIVVFVIIFRYCRVQAFVNVAPVFLV